MLQPVDKSLTLAAQNQPSKQDCSHMELDRTNVANLADRALSGGSNRQDELKKDRLATKEIQLFADRTLGIWHSFTPETTPRKVSGTPLSLVKLIQTKGQP